MGEINLMPALVGNTAMSYSSPSETRLKNSTIIELNKEVRLLKRFTI